jgi:7-cyano-7-deazaguanine reductase
MNTKNKSGTDAISAASTAPFEIWPNPAPEHRYEVHIEHPEYTALCPRSGYPDFGTIVLDYIPGPYVVELKAWKLYINSFRDTCISHEHVVNQIANKLFKEVQPLALRVIGDFGRRGNVKTVVTTTRGEAYNFPSYTANEL